MKRCVIFSYGPVPTPEHDKVEGGGLRCWGLAKGLRAQDHNLEITVAYHESYKKDKAASEFESINITTWGEDSIEKLIDRFDTVIVSYCMGDLSVTIANSIKANQQLVLDCYVPIYVEISARGSDDLEGEYSAFGNEIARWAAVLRRGDIYLCANEPQKRYYQGVLSALGRVNPATYEDDLLLIVPYGIYKDKPVAKSQPISQLLAREKNQEYKKILWFGGIYPWFDLRTLVDATKKINQTVPAKLVIVGAKNPFNAHPDFIQRYDEFMEYINSRDENKRNIIFQDWVEFNNRADWYLDSDLVILINKIGSENELAWRTRLVDYTWADLPILTNGGDPLGEELITAGAAERLEDLSAAGLAKSISGLLARPKKLAQIKGNLGTIRKKYYWDKVTKPLYDKIISHTRPTDFTMFGLLEVDSRTSLQKSLVGRVAKKAKKLPRYYSKYGARATYSTLRTITLEKIQGSVRMRQQPRVVFVAHQLDTTGAPHVFIDSVKDFRDLYPQTPVDFHTFNPTARANIIALNKLGIKPKLHISKDIALPYAAGDVIVLNTVAFSPILKESIYDALDQGIVKQLVWFIHEDDPELIFSAYETKQISKLLKAGKIKIFIAAAKTHNNYMEHFGIKQGIEVQPYRIDIPKKYHKVRSKTDFTKLDFILPGMVSDGRKGQLPIIYAFIEFKRRYYDLSPNDYRDFSLTYIGMTLDFLSKQILNHGPTGLGDRFRYFDAMSHEKCLDYILAANITICYSLREALPMFVYEGMLAGHPILRNDSSGMEEQLITKKNGLYLDSNDFEQVISVIETVCNKRKTSAEDLANMSRESNKMASSLSDVTYDKMVQVIEEEFNKV